MVQGPLTLNWKQRKLGFLPRVESAEISGDAPPNLHRIKLWEQARVCIPGAEDHLFIKVHTHGALAANMEMLFDGGFETLWTSLESLYRDTPDYRLHYVTARQMYEQIRNLAKPDHDLPE